MAKGLVNTDMPASICPWLSTAFSANPVMNSTFTAGRNLRAASATWPPSIPPGSPMSVIKRSMRAAERSIFSPAGAVDRFDRRVTQFPEHVGHQHSHERFVVDDQDRFTLRRMGHIRQLGLCVDGLSRADDVAADTGTRSRHDRLPNRCGLGHPIGARIHRSSRARVQSPRPTAWW